MKSTFFLLCILVVDAGCLPNTTGGPQPICKLADAFYTHTNIHIKKTYFALTAGLRRAYLRTACLTPFR